MHPPREPDPSIFAEPPEEPHDVLSAAQAGRNARYGLWLFVMYVLLYGGFIAAVTFRHDLMGRTAPGGANVAIAYGFGLIIAALVLALIYTLLCRCRPKSGGRAP